MSSIARDRASVGAEKSSRTRKPKGEGHSRRAEMLAAAERIFVEHGYEGATIRKIADEVGLSSTALYMHFADKGEILHEICRETFEKLIASNRRILADTADAEQQLKRMLDAYVAFGFRNPNAYRLVYLTRPIEARDGAETAAQQLGAELFGSLQSVLDRLQADGRLIVPDARVSAQLFWAGVHGVVSLIITKPYFEWGDGEALGQAMGAALLRGLIKPA